MKLLLAGPPASGKSTLALRQFKETPGSFFIAPTATMAEHIRHELARSGYPVRPSRVGTLARFLEGSGIPKPAPAALLHILLDDALERLRPARFAKTREFRGLHAKLAKLFEEIPRPDTCGDDLANVFQDAEARLTTLGFALRNRSLRAAAEKVLAGEIKPPDLTILDGFFTLAPAEVEFLCALAERGSVMVTLPAIDVRLVRAGFEVRELEGSRRHPERIAIAASNPGQESEEIARRVLEHVVHGRRFRDIGIILRSREPYGPLIETTLARFGIPSRSYFSSPLAAHPAVAYLSGIVRGALGGWDRAAVNALLRMPVSGVGATAEGDQLDFALRELLPSRGLPIKELRDVPPVLQDFQKMAAWPREKLTSLEWAERLKGLARFVPLRVTEPGDRVELLAWRSTTAAVADFQEVVDAVAEFAEPTRMPLTEFWRRVETALSVTPARVEDRRRDVVHVMDVYEARQWELPVVFVCGLLERVFPKYHGEDPVMGDAARERLGLTTSADRQAEERFLFELATTRATDQVVLSYARFDEKGDETLPSFFLDGVDPVVSEVRVRPKPGREVAPAVVSRVFIEASRHRKLSATSIEKFLQCPFQFFASKTLRLRQRPAAPRDRLNMLLQGSILHRALAEVANAPLLGSAVLDQVFDQECAKARVPRTYRTEAVRLELLRHLESFLNDRQVELGWKWRVEEEFEFALNPVLSLRGRIDRLEIGPHDEALVVDYKYSAQVKGRVKENEAGGLVQGGLYLLAAERALGLRPAGMLYCGAKGGVEWQGWHVPILGLEQVGESCTRDRLRDLIDASAQSALAAHKGILAGRVEARPADRKKCDWCDYRDICRIETIEQEQVAEARG